MLNEHEARYVLVGAFALQLCGSTLATREIDILIDGSGEHAGRFVCALGELGLGLANEWFAEEVANKPVTLIGDDPRVDVLTVAWSVHYADAYPDARVFEVEGVPIPTASIDHLIASKQTGRLQDAADVEVLKEIKRLLQERESRTHL